MCNNSNGCIPSSVSSMLSYCTESDEAEKNTESQILREISNLMWHDPLFFFLFLIMILGEKVKL